MELCVLVFSFNSRRGKDREIMLAVYFDGFSPSSRFTEYSISITEGDTYLNLLHLIDNEDSLLLP
jgi:hypothetical protein